MCWCECVCLSMCVCVCVCVYVSVSVRECDTKFISSADLSMSILKPKIEISCVILFYYDSFRSHHYGQSSSMIRI